MSDERRYDENEVQRIFEIATETRDAGPRARGMAGGMTLAELQDIGEEVGIGRDLVARAATAIDTVPSGGTLSSFGMPIGVERTVPLPRPLTDAEWERLVAQLRRTFNARGKIEVMGSLRQWSNGNLRIGVEPTEGGNQLDLRTTKGNVRPLLATSGAMLLMAVILALVGVVSGRPIDLASVAFIGMVGLGVGAASLLGLPGWARLRAKQMDEIADTVSDWTALPPDEG